MSIVRTWSNIDFERLRRNFDVIKKCSDEGMKIRALASANAYTFEAAKIGPLQDLCPQFLAVDTLEEGAELRGKGVTLPILVLEFPRPSNIARYVKNLHYNFLSQSLGNVEDVRTVAARTIPAYGGVIAVHLKVSIGEESEGFSYISDDDSIDDLILAKSNLGMYCEGIYTDLRAADGYETNTDKIRNMNKIADKLEKVTCRPFAVRHYFLTD